jgi:DNA mismatch endonuclease, patch repair protein
MQAIKSKNTKPELQVRQFLHKSGLRYSLHKTVLPGKPDLFLRSKNAAVFVHGCFWHGHKGCKDFRLPKSRTEWWQEKIEKNIQRDLVNIEALKSLGIRVFAIWECEIKHENLEQLLAALKSVD